VRPALRPLAALLTGLMVLAGALAAPVGAATIAAGQTDTAAPTALTDTKVVIVVGPTHGSTSNYRANADEIYAEAIKYSSNVTRIYSPYATWEAVKPALQGASIVVNLGHGNGWPSPYTYDPNYTTKDGFGLNIASNLSDNVLKYYGEPYFANEIDFAPNAVVILNHLCYSAGSSEPGDPEPTLDVARQRVDNFGAGFMKSGARAVIAAASGNATDYIRLLFTTNGSVFDAWRMSSPYHGHEIPFASTRTPGMSVILDPSTAGGGGYSHSIVGDPTLQTEDVTGVQLPTDTDPDTLQVPGAASVGSSGADVHTRADLSDSPIGTLAAGTALRVNDTAGGQSAFGTPPAAALVGSLAGTSIGWVAGDEIVPRDSASPRLWSMSAPTRFSPNGDGDDDLFALTASLSEAADWKVEILNGTAVLAAWSGAGAAPTVTWNGTDGSGARVPDGAYRWELRARDEWGNAPLVYSQALTVDSIVGASYFALPPARLLDTRVGNGLAGVFSANAPRTFLVAGRGGVPVGAVAVTGNLTITNASREGYVALTPTPTSSASTSTLNFPTGDTRANGVSIALGPGGNLSAVYAAPGGSTVHIIFDVTGYLR